MKFNKTFIFLIAVLLLLSSITAHSIPEIHNIKRKEKRADDPPKSEVTTETDAKTTAEPAAGSSVTAEEPSPQPSNSEPVNEEKPTPSASAAASTDPAPSPSSEVPATTPAPSTTTTDNKTDSKTEDKKTEDNKTDTTTTTTTNDNNTTTSDNNDTSTTNNPTETTNGSSSTNGSQSTSNSNNQTISNSNKNKKKKGLSGGIIALIVIGGVFAFGVVCLILSAIIRKCTKSRSDEPLPVLNVVNNTSSTEALKPQEPMTESGQYYSQSQYSSQNQVGSVVNDQQQYYDNGVDLGNGQYQNSDYNNGYDYPQQEQVHQPVRQFSSLRRPNANGGAAALPDGYDQNVMNGEITDANQAPHKVIINKTNNTPIEPGTIHKTQFPFQPNMDDELRLNAGDAVEIIEVYDDGWSYGRNMTNNNVGVFPISYITGYNDPSNNF